jgi:hypothetical protein
MACAGSPSTTAILPCLLTVIADGFAALISGVGSFAPLVDFVTLYVSDIFLAVPLAFRNLPWKVVGPIV